MPSRPPRFQAVRFHGIVVKPLDQQKDRDGQLIDPAGVTWTDEVTPLFREFSFNVPQDVVGFGTLSRAADGAIVMDGEINTYGLSLVRENVTKLALAGFVAKLEGHIIRETTMTAVGLLRDHSDPSQPPVQLLPEG